jgi:hypothetical protein
VRQAGRRRPVAEARLLEPADHLGRRVAGGDIDVVGGEPSSVSRTQPPT